jgi:hypothetical protein
MLFPFALCAAGTSSCKQTLIEEIVAWEHDRNANHTKGIDA